ncbi:MAG TPA: prephenate dehydrogenase/arogenate dehydrogenase family protein [Longimicrobium sp.]|nr:prephenate dehydrogenase/arogenate dehydrogenase family protein [Longimicrobium sp.]
MSDGDGFGGHGRPGDGFRTVAVAGLGLIGGSLARDLAARGVRVLGYDADRSTLEAALGSGVVAAALGEGWGGVEDADALVVAVPVRAAAAMLRDARPRLAGVRLITDAGSTKAAIVAEAGRLGIGARFVGAHPLAGGTRSGWAAARAGLFEGATVYLTPSAESSPEAVDLARSLWASVGGRAVEMTADEHDRLLAWTSHLPQVVASAVGAALAERGIAPGQLGPGGHGVTRLAASSPDVWRDILADNAANVTTALAAVERHLAAARAAIESGDVAAIRAWLEVGRDWGTPGS